MRVMDRLSDLMSIFDNMCAHGEEVQRLLVEWKIHLAACQLLFDRGKSSKTLSKCAILHEVELKLVL